MKVELVKAGEDKMSADMIKNIGGKALQQLQRNNSEHNRNCFNKIFENRLIQSEP